MKETISRRIKFDWPLMRKILLGFVFLVVLSISLSYVGARIVDRTKIENFLTQVGFLAPLFVVLIKATTIVIAPLGGHLIYPVAGVIFGFRGAVVYTLLGDILGFSTAFWLARVFGKPIIRRLGGSNSIFLIEKIYVMGGEWRSLFLLRLFGITDLVNYAAGLMPITYTKYFVIALVSQIPVTVFLVSLASFSSQSSFIKLIYAIIATSYAACMIIIWRKKFNLENK